MKVLVTGANGYLGSKVVKQLCDFGISVIAADIRSNNIDNRATFKQANIFDDSIDWFNYFEKPDVCLHMAWRDGFVHNSLAHITDLSSHFLFLTNLIDNGLKQVLCMGSMHEIGYWEGKVNEKTPCSPLSQYGIAKNSLRQSLELYCKQKECIFQWIRCYYIFGDDTFGNSIFCKIRKAAKEGQTKFPFTTGKNQYDFIHIDTLAEQISICLMQKKITGIINCCSGEPVSLAEEIEWYIKKNNLNISLDYGKYPERPYDSPCIYGDASKIKEIMLEYYKQNYRILVTGKKGQLGFDCIRELKNRGYQNIKGIDIDELDITKHNEVLSFFSSYKPNIVFHNAAWTAVDKAEQSEALVFDVNAIGTKNIAEGCQLVGAKMIYISTDYVFDGHGTKPFETNDKREGLSIYGKSKIMGEDFVMSLLRKYFIVRISGAFGINGHNFVKSMIAYAEKGKNEINVVNDQIGSVTYTVDLAKLLCDIMLTDKYGIYHATNEGYISWYEFAKKIFELANINMNVKPISTNDYKLLVSNQADRPLNSRLSKISLDLAGFKHLPDWEDALKRYLKELQI